MELKDLILSTLEELDEPSYEPSRVFETPKESIKIDDLASEPSFESSDDESRMLEGIRERLLVLFEGFQAPNNTHLEAKVDLTLNFLEYLLATIEARLEKIK